MEELMNKKWETKDGRSARVICTDLKGDFFILCAVDYDNIEQLHTLNKELREDTFDNNPFLFEVDKFKDLKRCESDGALIECKIPTHSTWIEAITPKWNDIYEYRIKDGITIEQWDMHKEAIEAFWCGEEIDFYSKYSKCWEKSNDTKWYTNLKYRVKPKTIKVTMQDIVEKFGCDVEIVSIGKPHE